MEQTWKCEICKKTGSVSYQKNELWFKVVSRIGKDHKQVSPNCKGNAQKVFRDQSLVDENNEAVIVKAG